MTYEEKWKADGHSMPNRGCPCDYGYEEQPKFSRHCARVSCDDCWKREIKEEERHMKYKVGDKVLVQGTVTKLDTRDCSFRLEFDDEVSIWLGENEILAFQNQGKTYEQGLQDAWGLAKKLTGIKKDFEKLSYHSVFGYWTDMEIMKNLTPQEALAKLKAYEEAPTIKVGDVVYNDDTIEECVVTYIDEAQAYCLYNDGSSGCTLVGELERTGKHIDIESLLGQIRG